MANVFDNQGIGTSVIVDGTNSTGSLPVTETQTEVSQGFASSSATARDDAYTVPTGKYWIVHRVMCYRANAGGINLELDLGSGLVVAHIFGSITGTVSVDFGKGFRLDAGSIFNVEFQTGTSGLLTSCLLYEEHDA